MVVVVSLLQPQFGTVEFNFADTIIVRSEYTLRNYPPQEYTQVIQSDNWKECAVVWATNAQTGIGEYVEWALIVDYRKAGESVSWVTMLCTPRLNCVVVLSCPWFLSSHLLCFIGSIRESTKRTKSNSGVAPI